MYCQERTLVKRLGEVVTAVSLRCRSWGCPDCGPQRQKRLIAEANAGAPSTFLTVTIRRSQASCPNDAARQLARAWRLVRLRIMRDKRWAKLPFFAVFEKHKSGWPHLHILLRCGYIDQRWLSAQMLDIINSPIVHIERISNRARIAAYVAKYCAKDPTKFGTAKRYWQSRDYDLREPYKPEHYRIPNEVWSIEKCSLLAFIATYHQPEWEHEWRGEFRVQMRPAQHGPPRLA